MTMVSSLGDYFLLFHILFYSFFLVLNHNHYQRHDNSQHQNNTKTTDDNNNDCQHHVAMSPPMTMTLQRLPVPTSHHHVTKWKGIFFPRPPVSFIFTNEVFRYIIELLATTTTEWWRGETTTATRGTKTRAQEMSMTSLGPLICMFFFFIVCYFLLILNY